MKTRPLYYIVTLLIVVGCKKSVSDGDGLITVDVTSNYPRKELILQDFMDVEYIPLETNDEFICEGQVLAVGKNLLIAKNRVNDGNIFIFDRKGNAIRKINRRGQGGEEYTFVSGIVLDEEENEIFVNNIGSTKILVYDLEGNFKRSFRHKEGTMFTEVYSLDGKHLICHDGLNDNIGSLELRNLGQAFFVVSKQDGSVIKEIQVPFKEKKSITVKYRDEATDMTYAYMPPSVHPIVPYYDHYVLTEISADTVYSYSLHDGVKPIIARTPSVQSMNPEEFLLMSVLTEHYYFMESIKKSIEFETSDLVYDKREKAIFRYTVLNGDFTNKEEVYMKSLPLSGEIPTSVILEAEKLVEALERGRLQGELKEIAANLDEESNPVIMLMKHKR